MTSLDDIKNLIVASNSKIDTGFAGVSKEMKTLKDDMGLFKKEIKDIVAKSIEANNQKIGELESKLKEKDEEIGTLRRDLEIHRRKNNLVLFNVPETEKNIEELQKLVSELLLKATNIAVSEMDLNNVFRMGKKEGKTRPILVSFVTETKMRAIIVKKHLLRNENVGVSQDFPKGVIDERKKLQPMVTHLNKLGKKATLRNDLVFVNGKQLSKEEVDDELTKFNAITKRSRSPSEEIPENERRIAPKLNQNIDFGTPKSQKPSLPAISTPSRMFPVFELSDQSRRNILSPMPGGSDNSKIFEFHSEK